jgi:hypothetical protein
MGSDDELRSRSQLRYDLGLLVHILQVQRLSLYTQPVELHEHEDLL